MLPQHLSTRHYFLISVGTTTSPKGFAMTKKQRTQKTQPLDGKVFVTGGAGFIGSHVVSRLLDKGLDVTCLILPHDRAPSLEGLPITRVDGDLSDPDLLARAMEGAGTVIHLAAIYAIWLSDPDLMYRVNVDGTRHIIEAAKQAGVKRVVHTSSIAAVGLSPGTAISDEETPYNDWNNPDPYVLSKYISELEALRGNSASLEVVAVNPAFPFGPNDLAPTPTGRIILETLKGRMPVSSHGGFNAVDVRDVAEGHILAAEKGQPGERYLLSGHNITYYDFGVLVSRIAHKRPPLFRTPIGLMKMAGRVSEFMADHVTRRAPMFTGRSVAYMAGQHRYFSANKAIRELGYQPRPLEDAVASSIAWFSNRLDQWD